MVTSTPPHTHPSAGKNSIYQFIQVISQLIHSPHFDPYSDVAVLCPSQADLRNLSNEEVTTRIHHLNNISSDQPCFAPLSFSPEEEEGHERPEVELKIDGFCTFSQPSIRNFLDEVDEGSSMSLWNQI
jgi:hypothetical protein